MYVLPPSPRHTPQPAFHSGCDCCLEGPTVKGDELGGSPEIQELGRGALLNTKEEAPGRGEGQGPVLADGEKLSAGGCCLLPLTLASARPSRPELAGGTSQDRAREVPGSLCSLWVPPPLRDGRPDGATSCLSRRSPLAVSFCFPGLRPPPKLLVGFFFRN